MEGQEIEHGRQWRRYEHPIPHGRDSAKVTLGKILRPIS